MPYRFDFTRRYGRAFYRGDDKTISFYSSEDGAAKDLTGATFLAQVRANPGTPVLLTMTVALLDASAGTWRLTWAAADGATLLGAGETTPAVYWYDIQRTLGGVVTTLLYGQLEVLPDISRA